MSTKLEKPIRREIDIDGELFTLIVGPDGLRLTRKRFRSGLAVSWKALMRQLLDITADELLSMGVSTAPDQYAIVKNDMANTPTFPWAWIYPTPAATGVEQYYYKR